MDERCRLVEEALSQVDLFLFAINFYYGHVCGLDLVGRGGDIKLDCVEVVFAPHRRSAMGIDVD